MSTTQLTSPQSETDPKGHELSKQASISPPEINNETTALYVEETHTEEEECENQNEMVHINIETGDGDVEVIHSQRLSTCCLLLGLWLHWLGCHRQPRWAFLKRTMIADLELSRMKIACLKAADGD